MPREDSGREEPVRLSPGVILYIGGGGTVTIYVTTERLGQPLILTVGLFGIYDGR